MKKSFPDVIISIVLLVFLTTLVLQTPAIPDVSKGYPMFLMGVGYLMTIILLIKSVMKLKHEEVQDTKVVEQAKTIVPYCFMILAYLVLMSRIGFIISTIGFMIASLVYLRLKNKVVMIALSLGMTALVYLVFTNILVVILPKGTWLAAIL